ncbi:MAG: ABC transporter ATP-binding protein [Oscillospiraceae bacterium]|nr:ABC transporter ATP-binding protein [Oscillospiraceae bacterium]
MIEVNRLSYAYDNKAGHEVLRDVSFDVKPGECVGILGNNGVGKSTLITCLCRIRTPKSGSVTMDGQDIYQMKRLDTARRIAYVAQKNEMSQTTVFDTVLLGRKPYMKLSVSREDMDICEQMIAQVGISEFALRYVSELSGGELQKVMLARALVQQPKLLLLDEPTSNLDPKNQYEMLTLVRNMAKESNISVLMVLHDVNLALRYCDRFLFLKSGTVYKYGDETIVTRETIADVYDIHATIAEVNGRKTLVVD